MKRSQFLAVVCCVVYLIALSVYSLATLHLSDHDSFPKLNSPSNVQPPVGSPFLLGLANPFIVARPATPQGVVTPVQEANRVVVIIVKDHAPVTTTSSPQPSPIPVPRPAPPTPQPNPMPAPPLPPTPPPIPQVMTVVCDQPLPGVLSPVQQGVCAILR